jgi:DNA polymerase I-like protein with 3'-5' exonuclease and polymerase domains
MFKFTELEKSNIIAIDTETYDPRLKTHGPGGFRKDGKLVGISIATDSGYNEYFPIGHQAGGNLNNEMVVDFLNKMLKLNKPLVFANAIYDMEWLYSHDNRLDFNKYHRIYDIQGIEATWLESQVDDISKIILEVRKIDKIRNTFIKNMILDKAVNSRIHCNFNPHGTVTGRFSSNYPNLQQVPARDPELGPLIRSLFVPEEEADWICADYSQQEPRVLVHYAALKNMKTALIVQEHFNKKQDTDFHQMVADMANIPRKQAKTINLGLFYGMGNKKLASELGLDIDSAYELFNKYHSKVPFVKELSKQVSHVASTRGYIKTLLGRKRRFDLWEPKDSWGEKAYNRVEAGINYPKQELKRAYTHTALNALIQGSSADITKAAMLKIYESDLLNDIDLKLTVHDELDFSVPKNKQKCLSEAIHLMQNAVDLSVPLKIDIEKGDSWGTIK